MRLGYAEIVAAELLVRMNVNQIREEQNRNKGLTTTTRQLATVNIPEQSEISEQPSETNKNDEIDELAFKDNDEENRMIVDTNILEEFKIQGKRTFNKTNNDNWFNAEILQDFHKHITSSYPMTERESDEIEDIWVLPLQRRWKLYQFWIQKCREKVKEKVKTLEEEYGKIMKELIEYRTLADLDVLKSAKVVGMTTTGAAKHQSTLRGTLRGVRSKIVIVEEAAEILEAHLLTSLTQACEHLILIGDHKQLRPSPAVYELAKKYNLEVSLFERLINNEYPYRMLKNQHRMCPDISKDISRVLMPHFYQDLQDDPSVSEKEAVKGVTKNLLFINHSYPELTEKEFKSHKNIFEAEFALRLAYYFLQQNYKAEQITILCTYLDQLLDIRKKAYERFGKDHGFVIQSVDNYQGEENDIIPNRVCVALSRAKLGLYVIGNIDFLAKNSVLWNEIRKSAQEAGALSNELVVSCQMHQNEQIIRDHSDFETKCREGGCDVPCNGRLECGHQCIKPCHVEDMNHTIQKCLKRCERKCKSEFQHPCGKGCWEPCDCQKILPCGHPCKERCGSECTKFCKEIVERQLPECGHTVAMKCGEKITSIKCNTAVIKKWPLCKHSVETFCSSNVTALPCPHPCNMVLPECEHLCKGTCGKCRNGRLHIPCSENCNKIFLCEHKCETKCSKVCPPCSKPCETECGHSQCGNQSIKGEQKKKTRKLFYKKKGQQNGRLCGEPCPPCMEECLNQCEHRQCSKKCGDPCDVEPCFEPCMKLLPCNPKSKMKDDKNNGDDLPLIEHRCIGICGEECLKICKICDPEKFNEIQQIFFGTEDNENARFLQLKDCGHIFEVSGLDQWIKSSLPKPGDENDSTEIVQIKCPQCKTSIRRSKRYISILNERAIDIEQIKQKTRGLTNDEKTKEQAAFREEVKQVFKIFKETDFGKTKEVEWLEKKLIEAYSNVLTKDWFSTSRNILRIIQTLTKYVNRAKENIEAFDQRLMRYYETGMFKKIDVVKVDGIKNMPNFKEKLVQLQITNFWGYLKDECNYLVSRIHPFEISQPMIQQITYEIQRFGFIIDLFTYFSKAIKDNTDFTQDEIEMISEIFENMNGNKEFNDNFENEMSQKLEKLASIHHVTNFGISQKERIEIIKAVGSDVTHWYKCPNGHTYGIGDCGGAVVTTKCPECKEEIGGENHRILGSNQDAQVEMFEGTEINANPYRNPFEVRW
uniref:RZ-type domain-containing protein n=1 Tax=Panagrolaimus sp. PS1159 TaxID=55785 RepID=A0AC35GUL3_9BILA